MFVYSDSVPPQDTEIRAECLFPPSVFNAFVQMNTKARVVRIEPGEPGNGISGFAAVSQSVALKRARPTPLPAA
jgi:hypothetical protein